MLGLGVALSLILGFVVYFRNSKSATNKLFLFFSVANSCWSVFNYLNYQVQDPEIALLLIRLVMFFAVLQVFSFFLMMLAFPHSDYVFPKILKYKVIPLVVLVAGLTLTPLVFSGISVPDQTGAVAQPVPAAGIILFAIVTLGSVAGGVWVLISKFRHASGYDKSNFAYLLSGVVLMFGLIIVFNFVFTIVFNDTRFIPLSAVFTLPFSIFTTYAIVKNNFFNVKVISTGLLTFALSVITFLEILVSQTTTAYIFRIAIFVSVLGVGILLIRSVFREVAQREQLQILSDRLADANQQLTVLDKARAEFISIASHQLRTPPATIKWFLAAILSGDYGKMSPKIKAALEKAQITNNSLINLIDDMLNASRIERGKMEFLFEPADVVKLTEEIVMELTPQATMKSLKLVYKKPKIKFPQILADKEKLQQVVNNLVDNAIKYTKKGTVTVELAKTKSNIIITVKDTGKGMAPEEKSSLFQKYSRSSNSQKHSSGLGLGLYVAKVIVEHHKGQIVAQSEGVDKGTAFVVTLPIKTDLKAETFDLTQNQTPNLR